MIHYIQNALDELHFRGLGGDFNSVRLSEKNQILCSQAYRSRFDVQRTSGNLLSIILAADETFIISDTILISSFSSYSRSYEIESCNDYLDEDSFYSIENSIIHAATSYIVELRKKINADSKESTNYLMSTSRFWNDGMTIKLPSQISDSLYDPMTGIVIELILIDGKATFNCNYICHTFDWKYEMM